MKSHTRIEWDDARRGADLSAAQDRRMRLPE
jgi:hypothetical protein